MATWNEIKEQVEESGNVLTVTMLQLREAAGNEKLGVNVRAGISKTLAGLGLGHIPNEDLPSYQEEQVRLYKKGTAIGDFIDMVLVTGEQNDKKLKEYINEEDTNYLELIEKIREIVAE